MIKKEKKQWSGYVKLFVILISCLLTSLSFGQEPLSSDQIRQKNYLLLKDHIYEHIEFQETGINDIINYIAETTGCDIKYISEEEHSLSLDYENISAINLIDKILDEISNDVIKYQWQLDYVDQVHIGSELDLCHTAYLEVEIYEMGDLLFEPIDFDVAPEFDLSNLLDAQIQDSRGGIIMETDYDKFYQLSLIIKQNIGIDCWINKGGPCQIFNFGKDMVIKAPEFIHRQIRGYNWE